MSKNQPETQTLPTQTPKDQEAPAQEVNPQPQTTQLTTTNRPQQPAVTSKVIQSTIIKEPVTLSPGTEVTDSVVQVSRSQPKSVPLPKPVPEELASVADLVKNANDKNDFNMQVLIQNLDNLQEAFSRKTVSDNQKAGSNMVGLYRVILGVINSDKSLGEFRQQWEFLLKYFKENEKDGFGGHRLFRGVAFWPLSHEEYEMFTSLWNLIDASNRWGVSDCRKFINLVKVTKDPVSEAGRGRLLNFYS